MEEGPGNDIRAKPLRKKLRGWGHGEEKDQLPSSLIDRFLLRINEMMTSAFYLVELSFPEVRLEVQFPTI